MAASLLNAAGLRELITADLESYERLALELARNPARLRAIREKLLANRNSCPLFDTARYAQALEAAEREKGRILEETRRLAERIRTEAQLIAQREVEEARRSLRREVAEQAVRLATDLLRSRLTLADQSRFVQDLIVEVHNAGNDGR